MFTCSQCSHTSQLPVSLCPFCSAPHDMLRAMYQHYGDKYLGTPQFVGLVRDYMPKAEGKFKNIFRQAVEANFDVKLRELSRQDRGLEIQTQFQAFRDRYGYGDYANYVLNCLLFAFGYLKAAPSPTGTQKPTAAAPKAKEKPKKQPKLPKSLPRNLENSLVAVEGGTFRMGCTPEQGGGCDDREKPAHFVTLSSFKISKYAITNAQYADFMNSHGVAEIEKYVNLDDEYFKIAFVAGRFTPQPGYENHPVVCVSWFGAAAYCKWAGGRLPTEAEWEFAARGGNNSKGYKYAGSNDVDAVAWHYGNSERKLHPVGQKQPNELGLCDMSGNVWEWCADWYGTYSGSSVRDPKCPASGGSRVLRGGSWISDAQYGRVASRDSYDPSGGAYYFGFRLVWFP